MTGPTLALPGSKEKIAIMRQRAEAGIELFHPEDVQLAIIQEPTPIPTYRAYNPQGSAWVEDVAQGL